MKVNPLFSTIHLLQLLTNSTKPSFIVKKALSTFIFFPPSQYHKLFDFILGGGGNFVPLLSDFLTPF